MFVTDACRCRCALLQLLGAIIARVSTSFRSTACLVVYSPPHTLVSSAHSDTAFGGSPLVPGLLSVDGSLVFTAATGMLRTSGKHPTSSKQVQLIDRASALSVRVELDLKLMSVIQALEEWHWYSLAGCWLTAVCASKRRHCLLLLHRGDLALVGCRALDKYQMAARHHLSALY